MHICAACILPETFPGITFDDAGVCNYCHQHARHRSWLAGQRVEMRERFHAVVEEIRGRHTYDCLMAWSGGKDSTYTLMLLRQRYDLNVLAFTFDNGFISPYAIRNIERASAELGVDHIMVRPRFDVLRRIFGGAAETSDLYSEKALTRASGICTACMSLAKGIAMRIALEKDIAIIAYGWSPGQAPLTSSLYRRTPEMAQAMVDALSSPLKKLAGDVVCAYLPQPEHLSRHDMPYDVSPLAFLPYDEKQIYQALTELGWEKPSDTDPNSTNCLLNAYANAVHMEQKGYNPYVLELANLVREGYLGRDQALERIATPERLDGVEEVKAKLHLN
jgi:hypothetical protein